MANLVPGATQSTAASVKQSHEVETSPIYRRANRVVPRSTVSVKTRLAIALPRRSPFVGKKSPHHVPPKHGQRQHLTPRQGHTCSAPVTGAAGWARQGASRLTHLPLWKGRFHGYLTSHHQSRGTWGLGVPGCRRASLDSCKSPRAERRHRFNSHKNPRR